MIDLQNLNDFQNWLEAKKPDEVVGFICEADSCPIATFVSEMAAGVDVEVDSDSIYIEGEPYLHSDLSEAFVEEIDSLDNTEVTAQQAINILLELRLKRQANATS